MHSLDRIDVNGDYKPSNCRWATKAEQSRNTRWSKKIIVNGNKTTLVELSERVGISKSALRVRIDRYGVERALLIPKYHSGSQRTFGKHNRLYTFNGETVCVNQLAKMAGVSHAAMKQRLKTRTPEEALAMARLRPKNKGRLGRGWKLEGSET